MNYNHKRITLIAGHYGSGKTNIAVNLAYELKKNFDNVVIADLDIVNPYFRTKDSQKDLSDHGIKLICSEYANTNVDIPALPQDIYSIIDDKSCRVVVDIGGDDRGALALGRYADGILAEGDFDMLFVINKYRPLTKTAAEALEVLKEIENTQKIKFTGIINNSNLGVETGADDVLNSLEYAEQVSNMSGLPTIMTTVDATLYDKLSKKIENLFPLKLQKRF